MMPSLRSISLTGLAIAFALPVMADASAIANYNDWTVFSDTSAGETVCYAATQATDKAPKAADHGDVWFYVTNWRSGRASNQPSIKVGYELREDVPPKARIGRSTYSLFSSGREAFADDSDDARIVRALKKGSELRVEAVSARNTKVSYHFSLKGSSKAIEKAAASCR
jgi:invasion protein IalB